MANQPTQIPPYPKIKYTDSKFREIIPKLPISECLKVEYKCNGIWFKMISKLGNFYNCECCGIDNVGPTPIIDHLRGKKHRMALISAEKLFHPQYTSPKLSNMPARAPILEAYNDIEAKRKPGSVSGSEQRHKSENTSATSGQKPKSGSASSSSSTNQKGSASATANTEAKPKPAPASVQKVKQGDNSAQAKPVSFQKPGPASSKKPSPKEEKEVKGNASPASVKSSESKETSNSTDDKKENDKEKPKTEPKPDAKSEPKTEAKEAVEVVVLDDDDEDEKKVGMKNQESTNKPGEKAASCEGRAIPVTLNAAPKAQRPQKRKLNAQGAKLPLTETKEADTTGPSAESELVINPAAVLAQSAEEEQKENKKQNEDEKPQYQQNRIITPSVNKKTNLANQQSDTAQEPSFAKKTFDPKAIGSNDYEGIIGVEYVVKILKVFNDPDPFYECCLCEVVMDGIGMQTHLLGYNHRYKYIEKHFPTCFNHHKQHIGNIHVMGIILDRVAKAIESHHGRELPYECLSGEFRSNRHGVMTTVYSFRHASEYSGPSFLNVIDAKEVDDLYKNKTTYVPPKPDPKRKPTFDTRIGAPVVKKGKMDRERERERDSERERERDRDRERNRERLRDRTFAPSNRNSRRSYRMEAGAETGPVDDATHKLLVEEFLHNTRGKSRSPSSRRRRYRSRSRSPHRSHRHRSVSPLREGDIWQAYRHLVDRSKHELDQLYKEYRKDPEKHPIYDEEWRKFWKHRKDQLARDGLDHRNYDFQPEWVRYFAVRIEELYDEAVEDIKINSRRRLILPMTNDELADPKYHVKETVTMREQAYFKPQQHLQEERPTTASNNQLFSETEKKTSVVSTLRLLTALEDYLGSLGPKVVDLLSKALLVEKTNPKKINEIILNLENSTILETAMEKLKGVLIAGLLEGPKVRAFNNVIAETQKILKIAYKIRRENPQPEFNRPQPVPAPRNQQQQFQQNTMGSGGSSITGSTASLLSQVDKKELATKLAAALTAQGKTDFNPEQLQQLIAVYSLIDKKKRDSAVTSDKQKMTLSDTLTALLNPSTEKGNIGGNLGIGAQAGSRSGNFNTRDKFDSLSNSSINNVVNMINREGHSGGNLSGNNSDMWQNLQNIQSSLRLQNNPSNSAGGGFGNNASNNTRNFNNNSNTSLGSGNIHRAGFGGQSDNNFNSGQNMNSSAFSGGPNNNNLNNFESGYRSSQQGMNNRNSSTMGGNNMMRGDDDDMEIGGNRDNDMLRRGRGGGNDMMDGGRGSFSSGNNFNSKGSAATGANNTLGFTRGAFLGSSNTFGGSTFSTSNFSGLSNFSTSITPAMGNNFQRNSSMNSGGGNNGGGGSNYNRGGNSGQSNLMRAANFNNQQQGFGSGGNPGGNNNNSNRNGSTWKNF